MKRPGSKPAAPKKPSGGGLGALAALAGGAGGMGGAGGPPPMAGPPMPPPGAGGPPPMGMKSGGHVKKHASGGRAYGQPKEDLPKRQAKRPTHVFPSDGGDEPQNMEHADAKGNMKYAKGGHVAHHGTHGHSKHGHGIHGTFSHIGGHVGHGKGVHGGEGKLGLQHLHKAHGDHHKSHRAFAEGGHTPLTTKGTALMKNRPVSEHVKEEKADAKGNMKYAKGGHVKSQCYSGPHGSEVRGKTKTRYI